MIQITERLFLGDYRDARNVDSAEIDAVVSITTQPVDFDGPHFQLPIHDSVPWPRDEQIQMVRFIRDHVAGTILVHCDAGISRSSSAIVLWLMAIGFSQTEAVQFVSDRHPNARPDPKILTSLIVVDLTEVSDEEK